MEHIKRPYQRPRLIECGTMEELTLGATGPQWDANFVNGMLITDTNAPSCTTNASACLNSY